MGTLLSLISVIITTAQSYYLSPSLLTPEQSISYCRDHCGSDLASFHSNEDYQNAITTIQQTLLPNINKSIWIGLTTIISNTINSTWSDGTPFDYAKNRAQLPWTDNTIWYIPTESYGNDLCTYIDIETDNSFTWQNVHCYDPTPWGSTLRHPLCNHCNGAINKYILRSEHGDYFESRDECQSLFGTSLGSIHTERDFFEAQYLCAFWNRYRQRSQINCWLGAHDEEQEDVWVYDDETVFDLGSDLSGGKFPWYQGRPDNSGRRQHWLEIAHDKDDLINDVDDSDSLIPICNIPSELCESMNSWSVINGDLSARGMDCAMEINGSYSFVIEDKQWSNGDGTLHIDSLLSINDTNDEIMNGTAELVVYYTYCEYFVYGVKVVENMRYIFIGLNVEDNYLEIGRVQIPDSDQYTLSLRMNNTVFILSAAYDNNEKEQLVVDFTDFSDEFDFILNYDDLSGYIGLRGNNLHVSVRSVYVSGTALQMTDDNILDITENCNPTSSPTVNPTEFYSTTNFVTTGEDDDYGVIVVITFHYPFDANNTKSIITYLNSSLSNIINNTLEDNCVDEYKIKSTQKPELNITILNVTMIVCDKTSQTDLIKAINTDDTLEKELVTKIIEDPDIPLSIEDDIITIDTDRITITKPKEISIESTNSTIYGETTSNAEKSDDEAGWQPDLVHYIMAALLIFLCLFIGIIFMIQQKKKNKDIIERHMTDMSVQQQLSSNSVPLASNGTTATTRYHSEGKYTSKTGTYDEGTRLSGIQPGTGGDPNLGAACLSTNMNEDVNEDIDTRMNMKMNMVTPGGVSGSDDDDAASEEYIENDDAGSMEKQPEAIVVDEQPYKTPKPPARRINPNVNMSMEVDQIELHKVGMMNNDKPPDSNLSLYIDNEEEAYSLPETATGGKYIDGNTAQ